MAYAVLNRLAARPASEGSMSEIRCRACELAPPPFERAVAYGSYESALRDLVHLLKFEQVRPAAKVLGRMLAEAVIALEPLLPEGTIAIVPVPLHAHKRSERGFNQAEVLVHVALKHVHLAGVAKERFEVCAGALVRVRDTGSQVGLTRHQRRQNLRGAFAVRDAAAVANRDVLVVDDVYTTGATAWECARVLRREGAGRVWVATVARTLRDAGAYRLERDFGQEEHEQEVYDEMAGAGGIAEHSVVGQG
jgi:ComF family protein